MGLPIRPIAVAALMAAGLLSAGCTLSSLSAFTMGNPFLPKARVLVTSDPKVALSKISFQQGTGRYNYDNARVTFSLAPFPNDVTPGVLFSDYTIKFYDQNGTEINSLLIPKRRLGTTIYLAKGGGEGGGQSIEVPVVTQSINQYGIDNGFRNIGTETSPDIIPNPNPWSQSITGEVTFFGKDDNQNAIQAVGTFAVHFQTDVISGAAAAPTTGL